MTIKEIKEFLKTKPGYLKTGPGKLAVLLEADLQRCKKALKQVRKELSYPKETEVEENLVLRSRWFNGKEWCESYRNHNLPIDAVKPEDWSQILKEAGKIIPVKIKKDTKTNKKTLIIWSSDKHIGAAIPSDALFKREYNKHIFHSRMEQILEECVAYKKIHGTFDKIVIADLGDSLDGYNGLTTRGGHHLPQNLNNKEASRVHFFTHKWLFESIMETSIANSIQVVNVTNDNHSGDFGWQANFALAQYGSVAWPEIEFVNIEEFIGHFTVYNRTFILTHGKDKKNRNRPLPLKVNADVESMFMDYVIDRKLDNLDIHIRKGDIHLNDLDCTRKKMTYWNVGSVFGASDWIMDNFSDNKPSCTFEVVEEGNNNLDPKIIWLK